MAVDCEVFAGRETDMFSIHNYHHCCCSPEQKKNQLPYENDNRAQFPSKLIPHRNEFAVSFELEIFSVKFDAGKSA